MSEQEVFGILGQVLQRRGYLVISSKIHYGIGHIVRETGATALGLNSVTQAVVITGETTRRDFEEQSHMSGVETDRYPEPRYYYRVIAE